MNCDDIQAATTNNHIITLRGGDSIVASYFWRKGFERDSRIGIHTKTANITNYIISARTQPDHFITSTCDHAICARTKVHDVLRAHGHIGALSQDQVANHIISHQTFITDNRVSANSSGQCVRSRATDHYVITTPSVNGVIARNS